MRIKGSIIPMVDLPTTEIIEPFSGVPKSENHCPPCRSYGSFLQ